MKKYKHNDKPIHFEDFTDLFWNSKKEGLNLPLKAPSHVHLYTLPKNNQDKKDNPEVDIMLLN